MELERQVQQNVGCLSEAVRILGSDIDQGKTITQIRAGLKSVLKAGEIAASMYCDRDEDRAHIVEALEVLIQAVKNCDNLELLPEQFLVESAMDDILDEIEGGLRKKIKLGVVLDAYQRAAALMSKWAAEGRLRFGKHPKHDYYTAYTPEEVSLQRIGWMTSQNSLNTIAGLLMKSPELVRE
jgi:hypothetical protein